MTSRVGQLLQHRELLLLLVQRNLKIRYKDSVLGFFWTLLGPLLLILIYAVFLGIMRFQVSMSLLFTGIFAWQYLATCLGDSAAVVIGSANLIKKTAFPRIVLPLAMVLANLINFLLSLLVVVVYLLIHGEPMGFLGWAFVALIFHVALCAGVSLLVSATNVFYRDVQQVLSVATLAWFFVTPVIYPPELVTGRFGGALQYLYFANPMTGILAGYRAALMNAPCPGLGPLALSFAVSAGVLLLGILVFQRCQIRFADEL